MGPDQRLVELSLSLFSIWTQSHSFTSNGNQTGARKPITPLAFYLRSYEDTMLLLDAEKILVSLCGCPQFWNILVQAHIFIRGSAIATRIGHVRFQKFDLNKDWTKASCMFTPYPGTMFTVAW